MIRRIFAGWEPHKWKVCVPRLGGFGTVGGTQADDLCAQREFFPERSQRSKNSAGPHTLESLRSSADGTAERKSNERSAAAE